MILASTFVVVAFGLLFIASSVVVFVAPVIAKRFLSHFASSARTHYAEQVIRLLFGMALVTLSPDMWQSRAFWLVGWAIVVSSVALMCAPWQWHHRFGEWIRPMFMRYLKLYAIGAFAFGAFLLYGVFVDGRAA
jgi:hypothetical protein